ncbi:hypothetical protein [Paraburkholderia oxyphila]|uniref:hypothetical protein n=1 Tax=Paraburkholderia oxyphila TaxID=614212 RepID=UPI0012EE4DFB|nr:hypothetical protein [Paraburkholderia oxyphila]
MQDDDDIALDLSELTVGVLYDIAKESASHGEIHDRGFVLHLSPDATVEEFGAQINRGEIGTCYFTAPMYWELLKKEFRLLLCTNDKKYRALRKHLAKTGDKSQLAVVSAISAAVAASLSVTAAALVPVCAICLIAVLKLGKEAYCQTQNLDVKIGSDHTIGSRSNGSDAGDLSAKKTTKRSAHNKS